jgi:hypothetical protein
MLVVLPQVLGYSFEFFWAQIVITCEARLLGLELKNLLKDKFAYLFIIPP